MTIEIQQTSTNECGEVLYQIKVDHKVLKKDATMPEMLDFLRWTDGKVNQNG